MHHVNVVQLAALAARSASPVRQFTPLSYSLLGWPFASAAHHDTPPVEPIRQKITSAASFKAPYSNIGILQCRNKQTCAPCGDAGLRPKAPLVTPSVSRMSQPLHQFSSIQLARFTGSSHRRSFHSATPLYAPQSGGYLRTGQAALGAEQPRILVTGACGQVGLELVPYMRNM